MPSSLTEILRFRCSRSLVSVARSTRVAQVQRRLKLEVWELILASQTVFQLLFSPRKGSHSQNLAPCNVVSCPQASQGPLAVFGVLLTPKNGGFSTFSVVLSQKFRRNDVQVKELELSNLTSCLGSAQGHLNSFWSAFDSENGDILALIHTLRSEIFCKNDCPLHKCLQPLSSHFSFQRLSTLVSCTCSQLGLG